ncbi:hypothetical protein AL755_09535 [Arthrobacter sp. ERGS1:01]|uniref:TULIP family P47-like protein n=1 Tax=Arthrobacter sp. ERGS1:01 TaxID=1704044 RepID=UPI0006B4679D|nr:TULIP family P47-like protein [Arthrobacter sp. ERGS1:01]ALE05666.1 hypothetical protein AL755_09535 [Arthrobacter sp. ERGS1:01]
MKTFGWDTVFAIKTDQVNTMLAANSEKTVLDFTVPLPGGGDRTASGRFLAWQITDGGSSEIIHLKLTIAGGTLSDGATSYPLQGLTLVIATHLKWIERTTQEEDLQFDYNRLGEPDNPPERGELAVIALRDPDRVLPPDLNALLAYALGGFLVQNAGSVRFVFAAVNLIPPATNSWLTPRQNAYGYFQAEGSLQGFLVIYSVTNDRDISQLQRTVDPTVLPTTTNASFTISDELYLTNIIAPSLGNAFSTGTDAFRFDAGQGVLRNTRRLHTRTVRSGLINYYPFIDSLEVRSGEGALQGRYAGGVDLKAGISMTYTIGANNAARFTDGILQFAPDPRPSESHTAHIPWYWFIGGLIVIAIIEIVVPIISNDIARQISNDNRERLALGKYPPSSILWGGSSALTVADIRVNGAMQLSGNI